MLLFHHCMFWDFGVLLASSDLAFYFFGCQQSCRVRPGLLVMSFLYTYTGGLNAVPSVIKGDCIQVVDRAVSENYM